VHHGNSNSRKAKAERGRTTFVREIYHTFHPVHLGTIGDALAAMRDLYGMLITPNTSLG